MATPATIFRQIWKQLDAAEKSNAQWEAKQLVAHVCGLNPVTLGGRTDDCITEGQLDDLTQLTARRVTGEPLAHLIGSSEFYGLQLQTPPGVLVPRPDTEILVDTVLSRLDDKPRCFWDIGTGTGAISLALLAARPAWRGVASDISATAVQVAMENGRHLGLAARLQVAQGDGEQALEQSKSPEPVPFDLIVSNPPYIARDEIDGLMEEVKYHDPARALDGGADGLDFYRRILGWVSRWLRPGGVLALEIGHDQAAAVVGLATAAGITDLELIQDLAGNDRVVTGNRPSR